MSDNNNVTLNDLWSYISNRVACKTNDPFEDLNGIIIPISKDGNFMSPLYSDEYDDVYDWIAHLCRNTKLFETQSFGFMIPGWKKDPETLERIGKNIMFILVKSHTEMEVGVWDLDTNEVNLFPEQHDSESQSSGPIAAALGALSVGIEISNGGMGEAGELMREALRLVERGEAMAARALKMLQQKTNS